MLHLRRRICTPPPLVAHMDRISSTSAELRYFHLHSGTICRPLRQAMLSRIAVMRFQGLFTAQKSIISPSVDAAGGFFLPVPPHQLFPSGGFIRPSKLYGPRRNPEALFFGLSHAWAFSPFATRCGWETDTDAPLYSPADFFRRLSLETLPARPDIYRCIPIWR